MRHFPGLSIIIIIVTIIIVIIIIRFILPADVHMAIYVNFTSVWL